MYHCCNLPTPQHTRPSTHPPTHTTHHSPAGADKSREAADAVKTAFEGSISDAFEGALKLYVAEEERELCSHVEGLMREERERKWTPADEDSGTKVGGAR
jgi:hypothetical protein